MDEGTNGLVSIAISLSLFSSFRVGTSNLVVYHIQYTNDTLLLASPNVENLWNIKGS